MHETPEDLAAVQELLDRSHAAGGPHRRSIITPERRLSAAEVADRLQGMCLLVVATATSDGRPLTAPEDGIFYRGAFHFSSGSDSVKLRHLRQRPAVSATHLPGEELCVTVHGRAQFLDLAEDRHAGFRQSVVDIYVPRYGEAWAEEFLEGLGIYVRIAAEKMFTFHMPPEMLS